MISVVGGEVAKSGYHFDGKKVLARVQDATQMDRMLETNRKGRGDIAGFAPATTSSESNRF